MAEEASNLFDAVRRANRAVWEQASGRKPSDESRAIPPPTGRESPLEGADASAMVAALSAKLSALEARVDYIEDDFPEGDDVIPISGTSSEYTSYFKVYDASAAGDCKVGVTDGGWLATGDPPSTPTNCGVVIINGVRVDVPVFVSAAITAAGVYSVWLHMWIDPADAESAEIIVGSADDDDAPDNPNGGVSFSSRLLGRISVMEDGGAYFATGITQDYLAGGEHAEILWGDCEGDGEEE